MRETFDTETPRVLEVKGALVSFAALVIVGSDVGVGTNVFDDASVRVCRLGAHGTLHGVSDHF